MDLILSNYLERFAEGFQLQASPPDEQFEHFVNYVVSQAVFGVKVDDPIAFSTGKAPGIDGIAILANDYPISSPDELDGVAKNRLNTDFVFTQAKTSPNFDNGEMLKFGSAVRGFFTDKSHHPDLKPFVEVKKKIYSDISRMDAAPSCHLFYTSTGTWTNDAVLRKTIEQVRQDLLGTGLFSEVTFTPIDLAVLKSYWTSIRRRIARTISVKGYASFPKIAGVAQSYICIVSCDEYLKLLKDGAGNLLRSLFYENVRDFQGNNEVNVEIADTLQTESKRDKFAILNNGITLIARKIVVAGAELALEDYQIVNGCQTSHIVYLNRDKLGEDACVTLKVIATDSNEVTSAIIKATNRQTEVRPEAFETLNEYHKELEEMYNSGRTAFFPLYYERRSKQYDGDDTVKPSRIVSLGGQINAFLGVVLDEPHSHNRYYGELLEVNAGRLFQPQHDPLAYFAGALAVVRVSEVWGKRHQNFLRPFRFHCAMLIWKRWFASKGVTPSFTKGKDSRKLLEEFCKDVASDAYIESEITEATNQIEQARKKFPDEHTMQVARLRDFTQVLLKGIKTKVPASPKLPKAPIATAPKKHAGTVLRFGSLMFGFIQGDDGQEYYVSITEVRTPKTYWLNPGQKVEFAPAKTVRGLVAREVTLVT